MEVHQPPDFLRHGLKLIQTRVENQRELFHDLIRSTILEDFDHGTCLSIMIALNEIANPGFTTKIREELRTCNVAVQILDFENFRFQDTKMGQVNLPDARMFAGATAPHLIAILSLLNLFIGKDLNINNVDEYLKRRLQAVASALGVRDDPLLVSEYKPSLKFCRNFNSEVRIYWNVRRTFLYNIYKLASRNNMLSREMKITLNLLRFAEMANFSFINQYLVLKNSDILAWAALDKYLPALVSAYTKYYSLGEFAPWAKLLFPPNELEEFLPGKLKTLYAIASKLAQAEGNTVAARLEGSQVNQEIETLVKQALIISNF